MRKTAFLKYLNILFLLLIAVFSIHIISSFFIGRSLWVDEALLAKSVVTRDYAGLCRGFLDYSQSAPIGYLLIVKSFVYLFGPSEQSLRLYSLLMMFASAGLIYMVARDIMKYRMPTMPVAVFMGLSVMQLYANQFKPYTGDVFFSLLTILLYYRYITGKLSLLLFSFIEALFIWFSFGALFTIGGVCVFHVICLLIDYFGKKLTFSKAFISVCPFFIILISVILYYVLWALPATKNIDEGANEYWRWLSFPLIPKSISDIKLVFMMIKEILSPVGSLFIIQFLLAFILIVWKERHTWLLQASAITLLTILVISSLGMYPVSIRLYLSLFLLLMLYALLGIDRFVQNIAYNRITLTIIIVVIIFPMLLMLRKGADFRQKEFYQSGEEYAKCLDYINETKKDGAVIYVTAINKAVGEFYDNYRCDVGDYNYPNIIKCDDMIWGTKYRVLKSTKPYDYSFLKDETRLRENVTAVLTHNDVYFIDVHKEGKDSVAQWLLKSLSAEGAEVQKEYTFYDSDVYHIIK